MPRLWKNRPAVMALGTSGRSLYLILISLVEYYFLDKGCLQGEKGKKSCMNNPRTDVGTPGLRLFWGTLNLIEGGVERSLDIP